MDAKQRIARRVAQNLVMVTSLTGDRFYPQWSPIIYRRYSYHSAIENGFLSFIWCDSASQIYGERWRATVRCFTGAAMFDSAISFALIRGGHIDACVLGGLQVDEKQTSRTDDGRKMVRYGGAMDLVTGSPQVIIAMEHCAKMVQRKFLRRCHATPAQHAVRHAGY